MKTITVSYGMDESSIMVPDNTTVKDIRTSAPLRQKLGYGDNVNVLHEGVVLPETTVVADGQELQVETACNDKG